MVAQALAFIIRGEAWGGRRKSMAFAATKSGAACGGKDRKVL